MMRFTAGNIDYGPGDIRRMIGNQERDQVGNLFKFPRTTKRNNAFIVFMNMIWIGSSCVSQRPEIGFAVHWRWYIDGWLNANNAHIVGAQLFRP